MFKVENNIGEVIGTFTSVKKAMYEIEQYFQCGTKEDRKEALKSIRVIGFATVHHVMADSISCSIYKI